MCRYVMVTELRGVQMGMTRMVLLNCPISIGNSMICSDIWHKYHE